MAWLLILVFGVLTHASYVDNGFTWLDHIDIEQGKAVLSLSEWQAAFTNRYGETGFYRPLVTLVHSVDAALYSQRAAGFHLTNVVLHLAVVAGAVLFLTCLAPFKERELRLAALIIVAHPLGWLPAGSISYRPELLVALGTLLAVYCHSRARLTGKPRWFALAVSAVLFALFSKETALVWIPSFILLWEVSARPRLSSTLAADPPRQRPGILPSRNAWPLLLAELSAVGLYLHLRHQAVPELWRVTAVTLSPSQAVGTRLQVLGSRLLEMVSPLKPALSDATLIVSMDSVPAIVCGLVVVLWAGILFRLGLRSEWSAAMLFLAIAIAPAANVVPLPRFSSPHYGYLASVGVAMLVLLARQALERRASSLAQSFKVGILSWLAVMSVVTFASGFQFADDRTLFEPEVKRDASFLEGRYYLGTYYMNEEQHDRAAIELKAALRTSSNVIAYVDRPAALINLAGVRLQQSRFEEADDLLQQATENASESQLAMIAYDRALVASERGDYTAVVDLLSGKDYRWDRPEPLVLLARALQRLNRPREALDALTRALPLLEGEARRRLEAFIRSQR